MADLIPFYKLYFLHKIIIFYVMTIVYIFFLLILKLIVFQFPPFYLWFCSLEQKKEFFFCSYA